MVDSSLLKLIGRKVRQIRQQKGISQEELADLAGLDRTYIGGIERGQRNVSLLNLEKISIALECSLTAFFEDVPGNR